MELPQQIHKKRNSMRKLVWFIKAPIRGLSKARDTYIKTMMGFAGRSRTTGAYGSRNTQSFSGPTKPRDEDLRELVKAVMQAEFDGNHRHHRHEVEKEEGQIGVLVVKKRQSTSVCGRIDEEDEMEFEKEEEEVETKVCSLRTRSCVLVPNRK